MTWKLGSLFDGSGGFPLAGVLCDIEPRWASEIEPYPIAVTRSRFPNMKHLGDISKLNGSELEPVDIITFGSPCQDLSVAGKRAGLKHEANGDEETTRSGLFMEAVRIIKEMKEATNGEYPRFALWENVPGAFSSNKGEDFRIVLEELVKIVEPTAVMPAVPKRGWPYADSYVGDGWSLAYRVFDAQYWGVPQRRRRIHLVLDLRGECAREVLFEREGLRGYFAQGGTAWENLAAHAEGGLGAADPEGGHSRQRIYGDGRTPFTLKIRSGCEGGGKGPLIQTDKSATLATNNDQYLFQPIGVDLYNQTLTGSVSKAMTASASDADHVPLVLEQHPFCKASRARSADDATTWKDAKVANTLNAFDQGETRANELVVEGVIPIHDQATRFSGKRGDKTDGKGNGLGVGAPGDPMNTLTSGDRHAVAYGIDHAITTGGNCTAQGPCVYEEVEATMKASGVHAVAYAMQSFGDYKESEVASGLKARDYKDATDLVAAPAAYGVDCRNMNEYPELYPTMQAKPNGGQSLNFSGAVRTCVHPTHEEVHEFIAENNADAPHQQDLLQAADGVARTIACGTHAAGSHLTKTVINYGTHYIVRRLTPTECARLQGFADLWGEIDEKETFSKEEYQFWMDVRNTHAAINGRAVKEYTEKQMLTWYNKLRTDSAEYKMWGNGIALPPALYCMQGIVGVLNRATK